MSSPPDLEATGAFAPPRRESHRFVPGILLAGRYRIVSALGKGGMGEVFRADDLTLGQPVALKFLPAQIAAEPDRLARFRREVAAARKISHPNVCRVYDIVEHDGQSFLTMEFVDGEDLSSVLKRLGRVPEEKGIEVARQLCSALAAVHEGDLLHRDLKPANVMLDGRGKVRLTDFGLAAAEDDLSHSDVRSGTPLYQSPEQLSGKEVTAKSDLYALGLVLYEIFTGKRAFEDTKRDTPPSKPSSHLTNLNPTVEAIILKCLETNPAARPKSAIEVLARLPGGDPLAAALAAGETPSPKMVADAPVEGTLSPALAGALLAFVCLGLVVLAACYDRFKAYRAMPLPPPAEMEYKAKALLRDLGYSEALPFAASGYVNDHDNLRSVRNRNWDLPASERQHLANARPPLAIFFYRESPYFLGSVRAEGYTALGMPDTVTPDNPPNNVPGMAGLVLDTHGRLVRFTAVPSPDAAPLTQPVRTEKLLQAAGLDGAGILTEVTAPIPPVIPPVFADHTFAWEGAYPDRPDMRIRVELASFQGRLVHFKIAYPDREKVVRPENVGRRHERRGIDLLLALFATTTLAALVIFAALNFRRADVRGAALLGATVFVLFMLEWAFRGRHLNYVGIEFVRFTQTAARVLFFTAFQAASYLTLEPVVRRRCPHLLTAWTRLFAGRWRDPLVGRDLLIGAAAGVALALAEPTYSMIGSKDGPVIVNHQSFSFPLASLFGFAGSGIVVTWYYASIFAVILALVRRPSIAHALLAGLIWLMMLPDLVVETWPIVFQSLRLILIIAVFARFGILATAAMGLSGELLGSPLSLDTTAWYFTTSLIYVLALGSLAACAAWLSLGNRLRFAELLFSDD